MTQEEKVKAYDESRKKIAIRFGSNVADEIFSQFEMSEGERIRKALINGFNKLDKSAVWYNGITNAQILAWLENQELKSNPYSGEKQSSKSTDDLTPQEAMDIAVAKCFEQGEQNTNTYLPSFDEAQGTPIVKQVEQKPDDTNNRFI